MMRQYQRVNFEKLKKVPKPIDDGNDGGGDGMVAEANGHNEDALKDLTRYMTKTPAGRYSEATNIPLDLVSPLTGMAGIVESEFYNLCDEIVVAQDTYAAMRKPFYPAEQMVSYQDEAEEVKGQKLLSQVWRLELYKHRRSVGGDHIKRIEGLAQEQLASNQLKNEESGPPVFHEQ